MDSMLAIVKPQQNSMFVNDLGTAFTPHYSWCPVIQWSKKSVSW